MLIKEGAEKNQQTRITRISGTKGNLKLRLSYQFEPGADADGVTVHIPLPLLNQVDESGFEWQIPGISIKNADMFYACFIKESRSASEIYR